MILPADINSRHKLRDSRILNAYANGDPELKISERYGVSVSRVSQIVKKNAKLVMNRDFERLKRLNFIKSQLARPDVQAIAVPPDKWIDGWRKELEGDGSINIISQFLQIENPDGVTNRLSVRNTQPSEIVLPVQDSAPVATPTTPATDGAGGSE